MSNSTWQSRRGEFNHQWLSNQYLTQLKFWVSNLTADVQDRVPDFEVEFVSCVLPQWERKSAEAHRVIDEVQMELSPRKLFKMPPLCRAPHTLITEISELCHDMWMTRTLRERINAKSAVNCVDNCYERLKRIIDGIKLPLSAESIKLCAPFAVDFLKSCESLKSTLESLPSLAGR